MSSPAGHHEITPGVIAAPEMPLSEGTKFALMVMGLEPIPADLVLKMFELGFVFDHRVQLGEDNRWHYPVGAITVPGNYKDIPDPRSTHIGQRR